MNAANPSPIRTAPLALWRVAQAFLGALHALFGAPEDVAARDTIRAEAHGRIASWLRCAEALLRRLLLIEAAAVARPNTRPLLLRAQRKRAPKLMSFSPEAPEAWRVSFRVFATERRLPAGKRRCRRHAGGPTPLRSTWPLAERYEALLRVFNDPTAYARRMSRRLYATPHRLVEALRAPPEARDRVDRFALFERKARRLWRPHFSSG
jgi:hypothetical protein